MASGSAPSGHCGFKIRPLRPEHDVPVGRCGDWLNPWDGKQLKQSLLLQFLILLVS